MKFTIILIAISTIFLAAVSGMVLFASADNSVPIPTTVPDIPAVPHIPKAPHIPAVPSVFPPWILLIVFLLALVTLVVSVSTTRKK